jgi:hypothetical protein
MKLVNLVLLASMSAPSIALAASAIDGKNGVRVYRYINAQGTKVTSHQIPPEYAKRGYQVLNKSGDILEDVPAELTEEQRQQVQQGKISTAQQAEQDRLLLLRYSSPEELKTAQSRTLTEIEGSIKTLQSNIASINNQIEFEQKKAAQFERNGKAVPPSSLEKLKSLDAERGTSESQLASRQQELDKIRGRFSEESTRYQTLYEQRAKVRKNSPP